MSVNSLKSDPMASVALSARSEHRRVSLFYVGAVAASFLIAYLPTYVTLAKGPWQTEQEGHGPSSCSRPPGSPGSSAGNSLRFR